MDAGVKMTPAFHFYDGESKVKELRSTSAPELEVRFVSSRSFRSLFRESDDPYSCRSVRSEPSLLATEPVHSPRSPPDLSLSHFSEPASSVLPLCGFPRGSSF